MTSLEQTEGSSLREAHRALTRRRILDAAIELLKREDLDALKLSDVSARAGMTERTLYRHFATREELLKALWPHLQARVGARGFPTTAADLVETPLWLFPNFDAEDGAVRASLHSSAGRELRRASNPERQAAIRQAVREAQPDLAEPALTRLCAVIHLIAGAYGWAVMKDAWDLSGEEAGRAASDAVRLLLGLTQPSAKKERNRS